MEEKLDYLINEMRQQTTLIQGVHSTLKDLNSSNKEISSYSKSLAASAISDSKARSEVYSQLTNGILKLARVLGIGMFLILCLLCVALFKLNFVAEHAGSTLKIGSLP